MSSHRLHKQARHLPKVILVLLGLPIPAYSYSFTPTEAEWLAWPEYCHARYSTTVWGANTTYAKRVPKSVQSAWQNAAGDAYTHLHHYCAGLAYFNRSRTQGNREQVNELLDSARAEMTYTLERIQPSNLLYPEIAVQLAMVRHSSDETDSALELLKEVVAHRPDYGTAYAAMAMIYRDTGKTKDQEAILSEGNRAVEGKSAEIHYFLGLYYLKHEQYEKAVSHAGDAYRLGYPLPGLRAQLSQAGYTF